ncbi:MAG: energy-coupling factor transporter transmembrane component T family protein [Candidatus Helarchaeota archaeon]
MSFIPFRSTKEKNYLAKFNSEIRFISSLIIAVSLAYATKYYVFYIVLASHLFLMLITRSNFIKIFKRLLLVLPAIIFFVIFIPFFRTTNEFDPFIWFKVKYQWDFGFVTIYVYSDRLDFAFLVFLRMVTLFFVFMVYLSSLSFTEFVTIRLLPKSIASSIVVMMRYIPEFLTRNKKLAEAQKLRGVDLIKSTKSRIQLAGDIIGSSLIKTFEKSGRLYESMKMRGFSGRVTITRRPIKFYDIIFLIIVILFVYFLFAYIEFNPYYL